MHAPYSRLPVIRKTMTMLEIILSLVLLLWIALGIYHGWNVRGAIVLRPDSPLEQRSKLPRVSILVPARNEEEALPPMLASLLCLDYPNYEVILVDDGSTDRTGSIAEEWAARPESHGRLHVIHIHSLPPGWRGKVWALNVAMQAANGEWLLATDADVVFHPEMLRVAMTEALARDLQLLSAAPEFEYGFFWEKVVLPAFSFLIATLFPLRLVNRPGSPRAIAAGAFILMRRQDFVDLGGYERLRSTLVEDLRTAEMFKKNGRRTCLVLSRGLFQTRMYRNTRELWEGMSRSAFEGVGFSIARTAGGIAAGNLLTVLPWLVILTRSLLDFGSRSPLWADPAFLLAASSCGLSLLIYAQALRFCRVSRIYALTLPLACLFYTGASVNSMLRVLWGSGVNWKGRQYRPPTT